MHPAFSGTKIALLCDDQLLIYQRDDKPSIPWPGLWDLPGGGREHDETPEACALREAYEEFGLALNPAWIVYRRVYRGAGNNGLDTWFMVAEVPSGLFGQITFGDEGQRWRISTVDAYLAMEDAIPHLQDRLRDWTNAVSASR
ncbi:NUDIX hydrolase [Pseudomonas sp. GD03842]|uniref:NUDIX hydrolase n=1 Tax=unclassified Pseudomonas TaxID=196821 RepID=UPI000D37425D|nr:MULTISPECIES: NUDIX hydrolase [unclassified Pseudomonas]MDH0747059.1 NUDIX hydrolase [Pseudomonas sp. GD03842]RAU44618.1 NUDIX domain-containing protein [Pseudomonas sp. RIT 409]RAU54946.1 NUDIX domain-containing protein [Pseudomonas sp. RIT 412]